MRNIVLATGLIFSGHLYAEADLLSTINVAEPIKRVSPNYPMASAKRGQEGWVNVSFVIDADGKVSSPIVSDSSGLKSFEKAALRAVKEWQYAPATDEGRPVQQCQNDVKLVFAMADKQKGATKKFFRGYRKIEAALKENDLAKAKTLLDELDDTAKNNLYEDAYFWLISAHYAHLQGDEYTQYQNLRKIRFSGRDHLPEATYESLLVQAFYLAIKQNLFVDANELAELLKKHNPESASLASVESITTKVAALKHENTNIIVEGQIAERASWFHPIYRNKFTVFAEPNTVSTLEVRCANQWNVYDYAPDQIWTVPQTWQNCSVVVKGEPGATVKVLELPNNS